MVRSFLSLLLAFTVAGVAAQSRPLPGGQIEAARGDFQRQNFAGALARIDANKTPEALVLGGASLLELNKFDDARAAFEAALKSDAKAFVPNLYLAEVLLREKKYADARTAFAALDGDTLIPPVRDQIRYRILITGLAEHDDYNARLSLKLITFPTSTPAYHYAQAAWEFAHGNTGEGKKWIATADRLFDPAQATSFARPLYDLGWIKKKPPASLP